MVDGLVSIITSIYNSEKYIAQTIESVQAQTYQHWEMLITDDCSVDNGCSIVEQYASKDPRIKLFHLDSNSGPGVSRNNSIMNASGQYLAFLDSDDRWIPNKLHKQIESIKEHNSFLSFSSYYVCDGYNNNIGLVFCKKKVTLRRIVCDNSIGFLTMIYDRKELGTIFLPTIRKRQDWGLNIMLLQKCKVAYGIKEPLAYYRVRKGSISRDKLSLIKYNFSIYRQILGFSKMKSLFMFTFLFIPFYFGKKTINLIRNWFI